MPSFVPTSRRPIPVPPPIVFPRGAPMVLSTGPTPLVSNQTAVLDSTALSSHQRGPFLIREIRWAARWSGNTNGVGYYANPGGALQCQLNFGGTFLTNGFVPLWLFNPRVQGERVESINDLEDWDNNSASQLLTCASFRWVFPRPLVVQDGAPILVSLLRKGDIANAVANNDTMQVYTSLCGFSLPVDYKPPKEIDIPYATSFSGPNSGNRTNRSTGNTGDTLKNPFSVPFNVQRTVGRVMVSDNALSPNNPVVSVGDLLDVYFNLSTTSGVSQLGDTTHLTAADTQFEPNVRVWDSTGQSIVKDLIPWSTVFDRLRKSWTFDRVLNPKESIIFEYNNSGTFSVPQISLVGFRREASR